MQNESVDASDLTRQLLQFKLEKNQENQLYSAADGRRPRTKRGNHLIENNLERKKEHKMMQSMHCLKLHKLFPLNFHLRNEGIKRREKINFKVDPIFNFLQNSWFKVPDH